MFIQRKCYVNICCCCGGWNSRFDCILHCLNPFRKMFTPPSSIPARKEESSSLDGGGNGVALSFPVEPCGRTVVKCRVISVQWQFCTSLINADQYVEGSLLSIYADLSSFLDGLISRHHNVAVSNVDGERKRKIRYLTSRTTRRTNRA